MRRTAAVVGLAWALALGGCTSSAVTGDGGDAEYRWLTGELEVTLAGDVERLKAATLKAYDDLGLVAVDDAVYGPKGKITGRMADGTEVRVRLRALDSGRTWLAVRVGQIGDEPISRQVLRHIERAAGE
jgi:hypothetical protein